MKTPSLKVLKLIGISDRSLFEYHIRNIGLKIVGIKSHESDGVQSESVDSIASVIAEDRNDRVELNEYCKTAKLMAENLGYVVAVG